MNIDPQLNALLYQPWSEGACKGYVIRAMENCGFSPDEIRRIVEELRYVLDMWGLAEAQRYYESGPY